MNAPDFTLLSLILALSSFQGLLLSHRFLPSVEGGVKQVTQIVRRAWRTTYWVKVPVPGVRGAVKPAYESPNGRCESVGPAWGGGIAPEKQRKPPSLRERNPCRYAGFRGFDW